MRPGLPNDPFCILRRCQTKVARSARDSMRSGVGEPEDVGRVIAQLLTEESGWINGQSIEVAGGYNI